VPLDANQCPVNPYEVAEAYVLGMLVDAAAFEEHYLACGRCLAAVQAAEEYVAAMREAAERLREHRDAR
jgi:hypothetical protein